MKTRDLTGMTVTEIRAWTQEELFIKVSKFAKSRDIASVSLDHLESEVYGDDGKGPELAILVWC